MEKEKDLKKTFVFYEKWYNAIEKAPEKLQDKLLRAVMNYAFRGVEPEDPIIRMAFSFIQEELDEDMLKYKDKCEKRKDAADKRWKKTNENMQLHNLHGDNNSDSDNDCNCDNTSDNTGDIKTNLSFPNVNDCDFAEITPDGTKVDFKRFLDFYNKTVDGKLPQCTGLTEKRKASIRARTMEHGAENVKLVVEKAAQSAFLIERNTNIEWIFRPNNFPKILEGAYDNRKLTANGNGTNWNDIRKTEAAERRAEAEQLVLDILNSTTDSEPPDEVSLRL